MSWRESFPYFYAQTARFSLGNPRSWSISADGSRVGFLRTRSGEDPVSCLWILEVPEAAERLIADPALLQQDLRGEPAEEAARRERTREQAQGIVSYSVDEALSRACFTIGGQLWLAEIGPDAQSSTLHRLRVPEPALSAKFDPSGRFVAFVHEGCLWVHDLTEDSSKAAVSREGPGITWGLAEFVAQEEMGRHEGFWWSPDSTALAVARVDESRVSRIFLHDPGRPDSPPREVAYPMAGTPNADLSLWIVSLDGSRIRVEWESQQFEYLAAVSWSRHGLIVAVQSRDQRRVQILSVDPASGHTTLLLDHTDPCWVPLVRGLPALMSASRLVWFEEDSSTRYLTLDGRRITPPGLNLAAVESVKDDTVVFSAWEDPTQLHAWAWSDGRLERITRQPGVHSVIRRGGTTVISSRSLERCGTSTVVWRRGGGEVFVKSLARHPGLLPRVELLQVGERAIRVALVLPTWLERAKLPLPVLMDPYGGPGHSRVVASADAFLVSQWFAEHGFAVLVADGRGTPGRGPGWEKAIWQDLASPVLEDQVAALQETAKAKPGLLDLDRVAIRGWSFGGFLAALAVLRRPDVFHAAVAGAPVTDHRLYDTHYEERYLGHPDEFPENYTRSSIIDDAVHLARPLCIIHGLSDDNVLSAHSLRLSAALLAAKRPHTMLAVSGMTHMMAGKVAEALLWYELDFLRRSLGIVGCSKGN